MLRSLNTRVAIGVAVGAAMAASAPAQGTIWQRYGDTTYDFLGYSVSNVGDLNGDGLPEVLGGGPGDDAGASAGGVVRLFDGATGNNLNTWYGTEVNDELGEEVSLVGDLTGDGISEFAYCAKIGDLNVNAGGDVFVHNGSNFSLIHHIGGNTEWDQFGIAISPLGDITGDGVADFLVGADQDGGILGSEGDGVGYAQVINGATGATVYQVNGVNSNDFFGRGVAGLNDVTGDGVPDFIVGAQGADNGATGSGSVYLYSGATGAQIYRVDGVSGSSNLGRKVANAGDVDGDGNDDFIAGMHGNDLNANNAGGAQVFSGIDGSVLYTWYGTEGAANYGWDVGGGQDHTGDGVPDLIIGEPYRSHPTTGQPSHGAAYLMDGATGTQVWQLLGGQEHEVIGHSVSAGDDINNDGTCDIIVGGIQYDPQGDGNGIIIAVDPTGTPPPPPIQWPNLPSTFEMIGSGFSENFDGHAGSVPTFMATNELNSLTRTFDAEAFCNIGNIMACTGGISGIPPRSGSFDLEMGGFPGGLGGITTSNGLVIGLDGTGTSGLLLNLWVYSFGEEAHNDDGIWLSANGTDWVQLVDGWGTLTVDAWNELSDIDLTSTSVDTTGQFYLLIAQSDTLPLGEGDGIMVDDITIGGASADPTLSISPGTAGVPNTLLYENGTPGGDTWFVYGFAPGSVAIPGCGGLTVDINAPVVISNDNVNNAGEASISIPVPGSASGATVRLQAADLVNCEVSQVLVHTFP